MLNTVGMKNSFKSGHYFFYISAERQKISKTIKKAEEYEIPLDPKKRKIFSSTAVNILPDEEDCDSN